MTAATGVLAAAVSDNDVSPGVLGFVVVALLGVATWLLIRSMNRQLKKIDLPVDSDDASNDASDDASDKPGSVQG